MASVKGEIDRLVTAKTNIEKAIEECGVDVPNTALISTYADYIRAIPTTVFSQLNTNSVGGENAYIESISQSNGVISATAGGLATTTKSGLLSTSDKTKLDTINAGTDAGTKNKLAYYSENTKIASYTDTNGSGTTGIYIKDGVPTEMTHSLNATINKGTADRLAYYDTTTSINDYSTTKGSLTKGIYLDAGVPTAMTYSLNATVNSGTTGKLAYYSAANQVSALTLSEDVNAMPIGAISDGSIKKCKWGSFTDSDTTIRRLATASNASTTIYIGAPYIWQGAIYSSKGFYQSSDNRLKRFYDDVEVDLDKLATLSKKYFKWKSGDKNTHIGISAQELQDLYPELVVENSEGFLQVEYDKLSVIALKAVDVLYQKLNVLEERLNRLENL